MRFGKGQGQYRLHPVADREGRIIQTRRQPGWGRHLGLSLGVLVVIAALVAIGSGVRSWTGQPHLFAGTGNDGKHLQRERDPAYLFAVIGDSSKYLKREREAGIRAKVVSLNWRILYPKKGELNTAYLKSKKEELAKLREAGFKVILDPGYQDTPRWVHKNYPNSYYVNQFGQRYTGSYTKDNATISNGDANLVFNPWLRSLAAGYIKKVFSVFGTDFYAVRVGGGRYGELCYPPDKFHGKTNLYWAYDKNARKSAAKAGIAGWKPGDPSPDGQARKFLDWYEGSLVGYQNWQIQAVRNAGYTGRIMVLYPGWGIRPGQERAAVSGNLDGSSPAEITGEIQMGHDFARQVAAIRDKNVLVTTTDLDDNPAGDSGRDVRYWSPVKYLHSLAQDNPLHPKMYGENTGEGSLKDMLLSAYQMRRYGLLGMDWYDEQQLFSGRYASLAEYGNVISTYQEAQTCRTACQEVR